MHLLRDCLHELKINSPYHIFKVAQIIRSNSEWHLWEKYYNSSLFLVGAYRATPMAYGSSQARGWVGATATSIRHNHSNTRSEPSLWLTAQLIEMAMPDPLNHWARPRVEPASSWILVGFVSAEPQQEFLLTFLYGLTGT